MSGIYGIKRGADVALEDIEVLMHYTPSRSSVGDTAFKKLNTEEVIKKNLNPNNPKGNEILGGMYTLKLPTDLFGDKGYYTLLIRPVEIRTKIADVGVLSSQSDVKGVVFDISEVDSKFVSKFQNNGLTGYRIEYLNSSNAGGEVKIQNMFRLITSNNKAEPVNQNLTNTNQKAIRYRFNDNSTLVFATVTPSSSNSVKPNVTPFIGEPNQEIILTNTHFNPVTIEIEMVDHDFETLAYGIFGPQSKSLDDGIYTIYNFDNEIYKQYNMYEIKEQFSGKPLFEVREARLTIDFNKRFNDITNV
jgi:hypothetical protein